MKKTIVGMFLALAAAVAFAMPSPKQIESALAAHDYQSASSMTQEVLREKPNSPKAHLFNAYILLKQGNKVAANEELNNVNRLDKSGDVRGSALFGRVVSEMERPSAAVVQRQAAYATPVAAARIAPAPVERGTPVILIILLCAGGVAVVICLYKLMQPAPAPVVIRETSYVGSRSSDTGNTLYEREPETRDAPRFRGYSAPAPVYQAPAPVVVQAAPVQQQQGMGMMGTAASVAGGVVAGGLINDMLHSGHRSNSHFDDDYIAPRRRRESSTSYDPAPAPVYSAPTYEEPAPTPSYESRESSYSSGSSSSSWDSGSSSSSSDSPSSWDSGSSSSDSGSSGGGDW